MILSASWTKWEFRICWNKDSNQNWAPKRFPEVKTCLLVSSARGSLESLSDAQRVLHPSRMSPGLLVCAMVKPDQPQRCVPVRSLHVRAQASPCSGDNDNRAERGLMCVCVSYRRGRTRGELPGLQRESPERMRRDSRIVLTCNKSALPEDAAARARALHQHHHHHWAAPVHAHTKPAFISYKSNKSAARHNWGLMIDWCHFKPLLHHSTQVHIILVFVLHYI